MKNFWVEVDDNMLREYLKNGETRFLTIHEALRKNGYHKDRSTRAVWARIVKLARFEGFTIPKELHKSYLTCPDYLSERDAAPPKAPPLETAPEAAPAPAEKKVPPGDITERRIRALIEAYMAGVLDDREFITKILKFVY